MSGPDLISALTDAVFALVFLAALVRSLRVRRRAAVDAALFFGAIAWVLLGERLRPLGLDSPVLTDISLGVLLATPYLLLRQAHHLVGIGERVRAVALAGLLASIVALLALPAELPLAALIGFVLYAFVFLAYGAVALQRGTARTTGVVRARTDWAVRGSLLLALAIVSLGVETILPLFDSVTRVLVLASGLAYAAAFLTPAFLKRAWIEPELRRFVGRMSSISPVSERAEIVAQIEDAASQAAGGLATLTLESDPPDVAAADDPAIVSAPLIARGRRYGVLTVRSRSEDLFPDDHRAFVGLLAHEAALVIDGVQLYEELAEANRELARATRAKSEFLANMSHELRTPMNAILGFSDLLLEQLGRDLTSPQQRYFRNIKDAGGHLLELINEVLDLSKVEAGRLGIRPEPIALPALVQPVLEVIRRAAQAKHVGFTAEISDAVVRLDPLRARQILQNLLSNAVKFTPEGGRVELRARVDADELRIEVEDTGIGIPADRAARVFGTFERLHEGRVDAGGTGLGLALTKKLVELHAGEIGFESVEGRGTTFRVVIPEVLVTAVSGERILVIDDTERDAQLIAAVAAQLGLATELLPTAAAGRDAIRRAPPMGVVLDLRLPDGRGEQLLRELKAHPDTKAIPVLVVSVEDDEGISRPLGAEDHLTKPIDRERVAAWMRRVAGGPGTMRVAPAD